MTTTSTAGATASASELLPVANQGDRWGGAAFSESTVWLLYGQPTGSINDYRWLSEVVVRVNQLLRVPADWDGYGASALDFDAADRLIEMLSSSAAGYVRSTPYVAITVDGGLLVRWENGGYIAQLESSPSGELDAYFVSESGEEHEIPAVQAHALPKWLWQASLTI